MITKRCLSLIMGASVLWSASAFAGVEPVQLKPVDIDSSIRCNRTFFHSSHLKNTIYAVPRVVPGGGPEGVKNFDLAPTDDDKKFILTVRVYFPPTGEIILKNGASQHGFDLDECNVDLVKEWLSKGKKESEKIKVTSRMPLTSIEVSITTPKGEVIGRVGRSKDASEEVDLITYYGTSLSAMFEITDEDRRFILASSMTPDGLPARVKMRFSAKHEDASVKATVDTKTLGTEFGTAASGSKLMTKAEVAAKLRTLNYSNSVQIVTEGNRNGQLDKIESMIFDKVIDELAKVPVEPQANNVQPESPGDALVSVKAVVDILSSKINRTFEYKNIVKEVATAQSEIRLRETKFMDPNVAEIQLKGAYSDRSAPFYVSAGQTFAISPAYTYFDDLKYVDVKKFLTTGDILRLQLHKKFPSLASSMHVTNKEYNGEYVAEGKWMTWTTQMSYYHWIHINAIAQRSVRGCYEYYDHHTQADLDTIPVRITFSQLGRKRYTLNELTRSVPGLWESSFHPSTGQIVVKALADLGVVYFRDQMTRGKLTDEQAAKYRPVDKDDKDDDKDDKNDDGTKSKKSANGLCGEIEPPPYDVIYGNYEVHSEAAVEEITYWGSSSKLRSRPRVLRTDKKPIIGQRTIVFEMTRPRVIQTGQEFAPAAAGEGDKSSLPPAPRNN